MLKIQMCKCFKSGIPGGVFKIQTKHLLFLFIYAATGLRETTAVVREIGVSRKIGAQLVALLKLTPSN